MEQVSRPYQVALIGAVVFLALWFVALRPKSDASSPEPAAQAQAPAKQAGGNAQAGGPAAVTRLGGAVEKARNGVAGINAASAAHATAGNPATDATPAARAATAVPAHSAVHAPAASATTATPSATRVVAPKLAAKDLDTLPPPIVRAIHGHKVLVVLFFNRRSPDDLAVRRAVLSSSRRGGRVAVMTAPIAKLARFTAITRAVPVLGSPTVVVIDRKLSARAVGGFIDREGVDELTADALRA
jgi:hypothetical protein